MAVAVSADGVIEGGEFGYVEGIVRVALKLDRIPADGEIGNVTVGIIESPPQVG
jgi:hypothetical protein